MLAWWAWFNTYFYFRTSPHCFRCQCLEHVWQSKRLIFKRDNSSVVSVLQNKSLKMAFLWNFWDVWQFFAIRSNFDYSAIHVEGKRIPKADALSRFRSGFQSLMPKRRRRTIRSRQRSLPRPYIASLDFQWMHLMASSLSKVTHLSYSSGQRCFIDFCLQFGLLIPVIAFCRHRLLQCRVSLVIYRFLSTIYGQIIFISG